MELLANTHAVRQVQMVVNKGYAICYGMKMLGEDAAILL